LLCVHVFATVVGRFGGEPGIGRPAGNAYAVDALAQAWEADAVTHFTVVIMLRGKRGLQLTLGKSGFVFPS